MDQAFGWPQPQPELLPVQWYSDGRKLSEASVVLGKIEGEFRGWYENGKLAEVIPMRDGKIEGAAALTTKAAFSRLN